MSLNVLFNTFFLDRIHINAMRVLLRARFQEEQRLQVIPFFCYYAVQCSTDLIWMFSYKLHDCCTGLKYIHRLRLLLAIDQVNFFIYLYFSCVYLCLLSLLTFSFVIPLSLCICIYPLSFQSSTLLLYIDYTYFGIVFSVRTSALCLALVYLWGPYTFLPTCHIMLPLTLAIYVV